MGLMMKWKRQMLKDESAEPITPDRFKITVSENLATSGFNTTKALKWKYQVTDKTTGRPVKTDYAFTAGTAYMMGERYIEKFCKGQNES